MGLDWVEGLRRAARFTGIAYVVWAVSYVPAYGYWHSLMGFRDYTIRFGPSTYAVAALSRPEAVLQVESYIAVHGNSPRPTWGQNDALFVSTRVDPNSPEAWDSFFEKSGEATAYVAIFYMIFWAFFRGVRWTILGAVYGPEGVASSDKRARRKTLEVG